MRQETKGEPSPITPDALGALLEELSPTIRDVATHYARDQDHTNDLVQECLVHIVSKLPACRDLDSVRSWARKVSVNLCRSLARTDRWTDRVGLDEWGEVPDRAPLPDEQLDRKRRDSALRAAVGTLPERERAAVELTWLDGLSYRQAAERMGVGAKAVRTSALRGIHKLRAMPELTPWGQVSLRACAPVPAGCDPVSGHHPVLALEAEPTARERVRAGIRFGNIDRLVDGVYFATGWSDLRKHAARLPGCPVIADPGCSDTGRSGIEELRALRTRLPSCPVIGHADPSECECLKTTWEETGMVAMLWRGVNDDPAAVRLAVLQATDREETESLLADLKERTSPDVHGVLEAMAHDSLMRRSVAGLSRTLGMTARTLERKCKAYGLPTPKRLLSLATVFHVERLARWSGHRRGPTALAIGFAEESQYTRFVKRVTGTTPSEVGRRGGPDYLRKVILNSLRRH